MALETEVKIFVPDLSHIQKRLPELGATEAKPRVFEMNIRYDDEQQSLTTRGIVLRLRQDQRVRVTYKQAANQQTEGVLTRMELETEVADFDTMHAIFQHLGFSISLLYEKYRTTYDYAGAEIVLDEMPYGNFIEVEGEPDAIETVLRDLKMHQANRIFESYVVLFGKVKHALNLDFRDLSFANFEGIAVPEALFGD